MQRQMRRACCPALLLVLLSSACSGDSTGPTPPGGGGAAAVATVQINAPTTGLVPGQAVQLSAATLDAAGKVLTGRTVTWSSSSTTVATVDASGVVTAVATGQTTITATSEGKSGAAQITVAPAPVASVVVKPDTATLVVGTERRFVAEALDAAGQPLTGRAVAWASSDTSVVRVSGEGLVTAVAQGAAFVTASSEGKQGRAAITVAPIPVARMELAPAAVIMGAGEELVFSATAFGAGGDTLRGRVVEWSSSNPAVLSLTSAGLATAAGADTALVQVKGAIGGVAASARVRVTPAISPSHNFRVEIRDDATGALLEGAKIGIATTDSVNFFGIIAPKGISFQNISGGFPGAGVQTISIPAVTWKVTVSVDGYEPAVVDSVRVAAGRPTSVFVRLKR